MALSYLFTIAFIILNMYALTLVEESSCLGLKGGGEAKVRRFLHWKLVAQRIRHPSPP